MTALTLHSGKFALDQLIAAAWLPLDQPTDWDQVLREAHSLDAETLTRELRSGEPYVRTDEAELKVWRLQTRIRIALRHRKRLPQERPLTCSGCGTRRSDAVERSCLYCAEACKLIPWHRYDSGFFVAFDTITGSWGIGFQQERRDSSAAAIVVSGFAAQQEAILANGAPARFVDLMNRILSAGKEVDLDSVLPIGEFFQLALPLNPKQWRDFLNANFRRVETTDETPYASDMAYAAKEFFTTKR